MTAVDVTDGRVPEWSLADRLRKAREAADLEQKDLAASIGITRNTVGNYEGAKVKPRRPVLIAWALATGVPLAWIEGDAERLARIDQTGD